MDTLKKAIQAHLEQLFDQETSVLHDAARYVIRGGGKRFRPLVILSLIQTYGGDPLRYLDVACALELIHLYSLIHDDLPAMDDDVLRHGQPTLHVAYDEATAILVGDGLLTKAFEIVATTKAIDAKTKLDVIEWLSTHAGMDGMIYGQQLDLFFEKKQPTLEELEAISHYKTGKLLSVAFQLGARIASPTTVNDWARIGHQLGLLFQIQDDVLEATTSVENMQKSKSDDVLEKSTFVRILGLEESRNKMLQIEKNIRQALKELKVEASPIQQLIDTILTRQY